MTFDVNAAVAHRLASEVQAAQQAGQRRSWRKVTTILDAFRVSRLTTDTRRRIGQALADAGLVTEPSFEQVTRADSVRLRLRDAPTTAPASAADVVEGIRATSWSTDGTVRTFPATVRQPPGVVVWYDLDVESEPSEVYQTLAPCVPGLTLEMLEDIFTADPLPKVRSFNASDDVRAISFVGVEASEASEGEPTSRSKSGELAFQLVEIVVGPSWMISCWHRSQVYTGAGSNRDADPILHDAAVESVKRRWTASPGTSAGALGLALADVMIDGYRRAHRITESWLESWELEFYRSVDPIETDTLNDLLALVNEFRRRLTAFNHARHDTPDGTWFPNVARAEVENVDNLLDRALENLGKLFGALRIDVDLVTMRGISDQAIASAEQAKALVKAADLAVEQRDASHRLKRELERVAALLLAPGLVAAIFGANTALPGRDTWAGFGLMIAVMILSGTAVFWLLRARDSDR